MPSLQQESSVFKAERQKPHTETEDMKLQRTEEKAEKKTPFLVHLSANCGPRNKEAQRKARKFSHQISNTQQKLSPEFKVAQIL